MQKKIPSVFAPGKFSDVWFCELQCCRRILMHREDGPAYVGHDGSKQWWIHGKQVTEKDVTLLQESLQKKLAAKLEEDLRAIKEGLPAFSAGEHFKPFSFVRPKKVKTEKNDDNG